MATTTSRPLTQADVTTALGFTPVQSVVLTGLPADGATITPSGATAPVPLSTTLAAQSATAVAVSGGTLDNTVIGGVAPAPVTATVVRATAGIAVGAVTAPPAIPTITGTTGNVVLDQLLAYLAKTGLIINATTPTGGVSVSPGAGSVLVAGAQASVTASNGSDGTTSVAPGAGSVLVTGAQATVTATSTGGGAGSTPIRARTATGIFGVNIAMQYTSAWSTAAGLTIYNSASSTQQALAFLNPQGVGTGAGILRQDALYASGLQGGTNPGTNMATLLGLGYKAMFYHGTNNAVAPDFSTVLNYMVGIPASQIVAVEGALEPDNSSWGAVTLGTAVKLVYNGASYTGWQGVAALQINISNAFTGAGNALPVLTWSLATPSNGSVTGSGATALNALGQTYQTTCTVGNCHYYTKNGVSAFDPTYGDCAATLTAECARTDQYGYPRAITEFGLLDMGTSDSYGMHGNQASVAFNYVLMIFNMIKYAPQYCMFYELANTGAVNGNSEEDNFGLFNLDGSAKQVAVALHDLFYLLGDPNASATTFTTTNINYALSGFPAGTSANLLQKADGTSYLTIWQDISVWYGSAAVALPATVSGTITFGNTYSKIERFDPLARAPTLAGTALASLAAVVAPTAAQTVTSATAITWAFAGPMVIKLTP